MTQRKQSLHFDNLGDVLGAAKNAGKLGTQQFETPREMAEALMLPLTALRPVVCDLQCGHGALLGAAATKDTRHALGLDIDPTATALPRGWQPADGQTKPAGAVMHGDLNGIAPLLREVGWQADLLVLNPPFSLRWPDGESTLVTWNLAHELLTTKGEGMMICNAATAQRLIAPTPEAQRIWLWVTLPCFFPGVDAGMEVAVLYFAADHRPDAGESWIDFRLPSRDPAAAREALGQFAHSRKRLIRGGTIRRDYEASTGTVRLWKAVADEWKRRREEQLGKRDGWNIRLATDGRLDVWLTPFQQFSGQVPRALAEELQSLHGKFPSALVVQKPSRLALERAVAGGVWRVEPSVAVAVEAAVREYHAVRAPFTRLNDVQRLGYLDEEDSIECRVTADGFIAGLRYAMRTETFEGRKIETRKRPGHGPEQVLVSGQELAILVTDDAGETHCFTQFAPSDDDTGEERPPCEHQHTLADLVAHFTIPDVPDVATLNPALYQDYKHRLLALQRAA